MRVCPDVKYGVETALARTADPASELKVCVELPWRSSPKTHRAILAAGEDERAMAVVQAVDAVGKCGFVEGLHDRSLCEGEHESLVEQAQQV